MTQEEKQLLLRDLCARLPYAPMCFCKWSKDAPNGTKGCIQELSTYLIDEIEIMDISLFDCAICDVKPYLRSMSSMTEEERKAYIEISGHLCGETVAKTMIDWLNDHHFDYRGLIEKNLALDCTGLHIYD